MRLRALFLLPLCFLLKCIFHEIYHLLKRLSVGEIMWGSRAVGKVKRRRHFREIKQGAGFDLFLAVHGQTRQSLAEGF